MERSTRHKIGTAFHESFALRRPGLSQILSTCVEWEKIGNGKRLTFATLRKSTSLGSRQIKSWRRYAMGVSLLTNEERVSLFGATVHRHDPNLNRLETQWLLHYHLCAPHHSGPAFWGWLVLHCLHVDDVVERKWLAEEIGRFVKAQEGREIEPRTKATTATAFLSTYARSDALGDLNVLTENRSGIYKVTQPQEVNSRVFAYALADYWEGIWGEARVVNLSDVTTPDSLAGLFFLGSGQVERLLREMQQSGLVEVHRREPPYRVCRLWTSAEDLLERVYAKPGS